MIQNNISAETKAQQKHLSFYLHENRKWTRIVGEHICWTLPLIALTLLAAYKERPVFTMAGVCASAVGIKCIQNANFYRRRSAYRVRQQRKSLENS